MKLIECARCGVAKLRQTGSVNRARANGQPLYCSQACLHAARRKVVKALGWFERRFEARAGAVAVICRGCSRPMWLPPSKVSAHKTCGPQCAKIVRTAARDARKRPCENCGATFTPRGTQLRNGAGRYCSHKCRPSDHISTPEALAFAQQRRREKQAAGLIEWKTGEDHHAWRGGEEAAKERRSLPESRKQRAAWLRDYRARNPHKIREWRQGRRAGKILERLPRGTIPNLGSMQRWRCAICRTVVKDAYHVDHIKPIAKGGLHEPRNLQLLCATCNLRKSAKDPIAYMQEIGRLL